jgi:hypothetical protein
VDGMTLSCRFYTPNAVNATFAPDGLAAAPLRHWGNTSFPAGSLVQDAVYRLTYRASPSQWIVEGGPASALVSEVRPPSSMTALPPN